MTRARNQCAYQIPLHQETAEDKSDLLAAYSRQDNIVQMRDLRFLLKPTYSNSHALLIGIDNYAKTAPLSYAVSDAQGVHTSLVEQLGFPNENITLLKDKEATREGILRAYLTFAEDRVGIDDRIVVFFAGHGHTRRGSRGEVGYLVPFNGDPEDLSTLIRWDEFTRNAELIRAKHMLFIMDACYGGLMLQRGLSAGSARFLNDMMLRYARQVLTAGKADEVVADAGGPIPRHSIFTGHLLQGISGNAKTPEGILTASGLMSYVYSKVASDPNSNQTPHYGFFDGDGDFILNAPMQQSTNESEMEGQDTLVTIPFAEIEPDHLTSEQKIARAKSLLSSDASAIELHDFLVEETRRLLAATGDDHFKPQAGWSKDEFIVRLDKYEAASFDLSLILACVAHWAKPNHRPFLQKIIARSTDPIESQNGPVTWNNLRWFPSILELYCAGIGAVAGGRYDSLASAFLAEVGGSSVEREDQYFVLAAAEATLEMTRAELFKQLPGHERHFTPQSEYLFKILQPKLDDVLFLGKGYETAFDEFEVLYGLVVADLRKQQGRSVWGPIGRFGWKQRHSRVAPLQKLVAQALAAGDRWEVLKGGLFGGNFDRFKAVATEYSERVGNIGWF